MRKLGPRGLSGPAGVSWFVHSEHDSEASKDCHAPKIRSKKVVEVPIVVLTRKMNILAQIKKNRIITFSANAPRSGRSSHTLGPAARAKAQEGYGACLRSPS